MNGIKTSVTGCDAVERSSLGLSSGALLTVRGQEEEDDQQSRFKRGASEVGHSGKLGILWKPSEKGNSGRSVHLC